MRHDDDKDLTDCPPNASGILMCLHMLTDEAMSLNLPGSVEALRVAASAVEMEIHDSADSAARMACDQLAVAAAAGSRAHH